MLKNETCNAVNDGENLPSRFHPEHMKTFLIFWLSLMTVCHKVISNGPAPLMLCFTALDFLLSFSSVDTQKQTLEHLFWAGLDAVLLKEFLLVLFNML